MSCDKTILVTAVEMNNQAFPTGCTKRIGCDINVIGDYWRTPVQDANGVNVGYTDVLSSGVSKPTTDSFRIVKLTSNGEAVTVAIDEFQVDGVTANSSQILFDACDQCCGDTPIDVLTTVPDQNLEIKPCLVTDAASADYNTYVARFVIPLDSGTYTYSAYLHKYDTAGAITATGSTTAQTAATSALVASQLDAQFDSGGSVAAIGASTTFVTEQTASTGSVEGVIKFQSTSPFSVMLTITSA